MGDNGLSIMIWSRRTEFADEELFIGGLVQERRNSIASAPK